MPRYANYPRLTPTYLDKPSKLAECNPNTTKHLTRAENELRQQAWLYTAKIQTVRQSDSKTVGKLDTQTVRKSYSHTVRQSDSQTVRQ